MPDNEEGAGQGTPIHLDLDDPPNYRSPMQATDPDDMLCAALNAAHHGMPVIPLIARSKRPHPILAPCGAMSATTDPTVIGSWFAKGQLNLGAVQGNGTVGIDIDGPKQLADLHRLVARFGALPKTAVVSSGRPEFGWHIYYSAPPGTRGFQIRGSNLQVRGQDQYFVLPPSIHPSGTRYMWRSGLSALADAPNWLLELGQQRHVPTATLPVRVEFDPPQVSPAVKNFETDDTLLWVDLHMPWMFANSADRSRDLCGLARNLVRDCRRRNESVLVPALASILCKVDSERGALHPKGSKYAMRPQYYSKLIFDVLLRESA